MNAPFFFVPRERIELSWIAPHDFESCASTNSAIEARYRYRENYKLNLINCQRRRQKLY